MICPKCDSDLKVERDITPDGKHIDIYKCLCGESIIEYVEIL